MAKNRREVFLFGAGAILDWGAPKTPELTNLVRNSGFTLKNSNTKITEFIYQKLIENGYSESEVNFETIINVIEELIIYYSEHNSKNRTPSLLASFLSAKYEEELLNFEGVDYERYKFPNNDENKNQFFFQHLLSRLLININKRISKYALHSSSDSAIDKNFEISLLFRESMRNVEKNSCLRLYTLNYDQIFRILLEKDGISCFDGFSGKISTQLGEPLRANVPRIHTEINSNIHYNLHGYLYWRVVDEEQLSNPEIIFSGFPELDGNDENASIQVEKGKSVLLSNIVTGYQKAQRAMVAPYKQMQAAFDRDCCCADRITIIGYSFGDEHINQSIKMAMRYNKDVIIEVVDPFFMSNDKDFEFILRFFPYYGGGIQRRPTTEENFLHTYYNGRFKVYTLDFNSYMKQNLME